MAQTVGRRLLLRSLYYLLEVLIVSIPMDFYRWLTFRTKTVTDQVVVVTGGAMGIGKRMGEMFAFEHNAKVVILDIDRTEGVHTTEEIKRQGGRAYFWHCDVGDSEQVRERARQIGNHKELGQVDILICNAGVLIMKHILDFEDDELQKSFNVNVMGFYNTIRAFVGPMMNRNQGQVVGMSSIAGHYGETYGSAYCSKFAVRGIMESLQMEFLDRGFDGIKCTTICPYFTRTSMIHRQLIRPTASFLPFMSINRCARESVDAILKEKVIVCIPNCVSIIVMSKSFMTKNVLISCRNYVNCRFAPGNETDME